METRIYHILRWSRLAGRENKERAKRDEIDQKEVRVTKERPNISEREQSDQRERESREKSESRETRERLARTEGDP